MLRALAEILYNKSAVVRWLKNKNPEEEIVFASAATILKTKETVPIGWSFRRLFQHRGVVIVTRNQIFLKNSLFSLQFIFYLFLLVLSVNNLFETRDLISLFVAIFFGLVAAQFLPYQRQIPFTDIRDVKLESVRGIFAKGSLFTLYVKDTSINIVPAQILSKDITQIISASNK